MKAIALALGAALTVGAAGAFAQYENRPEPWNDIRNGAGWGENRWGWREERARQDRYYYETRGWRGRAHECWNFRARTFELAREGEFQEDLDYGRCRPVAYRVDPPVYREYYYR